MLEETTTTVIALIVEIFYDQFYLNMSSNVVLLFYRLLHGNAKCATILIKHLLKGEMQQDTLWDST